MRAWTFLGESEPPAGTDTLGATRQMIALGPARGVVVLVSDLLDPSWLAAVDLLRHERFDVAVVAIRSPGELALPLHGERFDLVDGETGAVLSGVSRGELTAARDAARARWDAVEDNCRRRGVPVARTLTSTSPFPGWGAATSLSCSTSGEPYWVLTIAFIVFPSKPRFLDGQLFLATVGRWNS